MNGVYQALSDPTRRQILKLLRERDMTAGEIARHLHADLIEHAQHCPDDQAGNTQGIAAHPKRLDPLNQSNDDQNQWNSIDQSI